MRKERFFFQKYPHICAYSIPQIRVVDKIQSIGQTYFYMSTSPKTQYSYNVVKKLVKQALGASFVFFCASQNYVPNIVTYRMLCLMFEEFSKAPRGYFLLKFDIFYCHGRKKSFPPLKSMWVRPCPSHIVSN